MKKSILSLLAIGVFILYSCNGSSSKNEQGNMKSNEASNVKNIVLDTVKVSALTKMIAPSLSYADIVVPDQTIEANQTLSIPYLLAAPAGQAPIGIWIGQHISGAGYPEMTFSIQHVTATGFDLRIHNTTEPAGFSGPGHGERPLKNERIRIIFLLP